MCTDPPTSKASCTLQLPPKDPDGKIANVRNKFAICIAVASTCRVLLRAFSSRMILIVGARKLRPKKCKRSCKIRLQIATTTGVVGTRSASPFADRDEDVDVQVEATQ